MVWIRKRSSPSRTVSCSSTVFRSCCIRLRRRFDADSSTSLLCLHQTIQNVGLHAIIAVFEPSMYHAACYMPFMYDAYQYISFAENVTPDMVQEEVQQLQLGSNLIAFDI